MSENEIHDAYRKVTDLLKQKRIKEAHASLLTLLGEKGDWNLRNRLEQLQTSYQYMLQYMRQGSEDPERSKLYQRIITETWEIADQTHINLLDGVSTHFYHEVHKHRKYMAVGYHMYDWLRKLESFEDDLAICELMPDNQKSLNDVLKQHEEINKYLFLSTWGNAAWTREDALDSKQILASEQLSSNDRSLFISALTLSLQECFDVFKFTWLLTAVTLKNDVQSVQRALVGIALTLLRHPDRLKFYPELGERIAMLDEKYQLGQKLNIIYLQLIRAQETEKINKRIQEEILPEMLKQAEKFKGKKLNFEDLPDEEDLNPDWKKAFEDNDFENKMREMTDLQMEGMDVNLSTFSQLKRFPFFNEAQNWLLPFDYRHSSIIQTLEQNKKPNSILNMVMQSGMLCSSDKYSMCFLMSNVPEAQRQMMINNLANKDIEEMLDSDRMDEIKKNAQRPVTISNMYIQDLYRFYKLNQRKEEFFNPFTHKIELHRIPALATILSKPELLKEVADYRVNKGHLNEALAIYQQLIEQKNADAEIFQKTGYCYQKLTRYTEAIDAYQKAELLKPEHLWTNRHLATCYRRTRQFDKALIYYQKVEEVQPENKTVIYYTASCLSELERYDEALNRFFKLDFLEDNNVKAWRAIGWCSFLCGKLEQAQRYYQKVIEQEPKATDYLNAGHIAWKTGNLDEAVTFYGKAVMLCGSKDIFMEHFVKDQDILLSQGIKKEDIPLVLDMI